MVPRLPVVELKEGIRVSLREMQVMDALCVGIRVHRIATRMHITARSLKDYMRRAYERNGMTRCEFFRAYAAAFNRRVFKLERQR